MNHERQKTIYSTDASRYDALVSAEDCDGHLLPAIKEVCPVQRARVLDLGAGTGRLARLLTGAGAAVTAVDRADAMLRVARDRVDPPRTNSTHYVQAQADALPFGEGGFDFACAGWVFGHFPSWSPDSWRQAIGAGLGEMTRVVTRGGSLVILETLGTAVDRAHPPNRGLAEYYAWLEDDQGFQRRVLGTDYRFASVEEAVALVEFFFGAALAARVRTENRTRVREFTGLWWRRR